ncbi:adenosylmethionine decarboxylase [Comamonas testosteroni]
MDGLHLTADLYQCQCAPSLLTEQVQLAQLCVGQTMRSGLTVVAQRWHSFAPVNDQPAGVTGTVLLAESHLAIHTWPESGSVSLDLYVCNFSEDNTAKAHALMQSLLKALAPTRVHQQQLRRGDASAAVAFGVGSGSNGDR